MTVLQNWGPQARTPKAKLPALHPSATKFFQSLLAQREVPIITKLMVYELKGSVRCAIFQNLRGTNESRLELARGALIQRFPKQKVNSSGR